ncbi:hypothetical protein AB4403_06380 [Vibrio breoganii]
MDPKQNIDLPNNIATSYFLQSVDSNTAEAENGLEFLQDKLSEVTLQLTGNEEVLTSTVKTMNLLIYYYKHNRQLK